MAMSESLSHYCTQFPSHHPHGSEVAMSWIICNNSEGVKKPLDLWSASDFCKILWSYLIQFAALRQAPSLIHKSALKDKLKPSNLCTALLKITWRKLSLKTVIKIFEAMFNFFYLNKLNWENEFKFALMIFKQSYCS